MIIKKLFQYLFVLCLVFFTSTTFAAVELGIDSLTLQGGSEVYQDTEISVVMILRNSGNSTLDVTSPIQPGFISCSVWSNTVFSSMSIVNLHIDPFTVTQFPITLSRSATSNLWGQTLICHLGFHNPWIIVGPTKTLSFTVKEKSGWRFDNTLEQVRDPLKEHIDWPIAELWKWGIKTFIYLLIDKIAIPGAVFVWILFAVLALYKIMFSEEENKLSEIGWLITWGVAGIVIIMSAKFIWSVLYNNILWTGEMGTLSMVDIVSKTYNLILWPLLKIAFYIMISVLFILLLIRVFSFVTSDSQEIKKKSTQIIISSIVWLFVMLGAKQLVEGVYGKEELIRNSAAVTITQIGGSFLSDANIPLIYGIIQWVMGLSGFILLAIIIFQTYRMLINPTDEENTSRIKNILLYALIGMLVIGAGYLIVNVLMIN